MTDIELDALAQRVGRTLAAHGWRLATAESCTGGWVAEAVTAISGSSAWFDRGFVTYSNEAKMDMLGVSARTLGEHGAVSEATVVEMAAGALSRSLADVAVAVSGVAGPSGGTAAKPVGMVCLAWAARDGVSRVLTAHFDGEREAVRRQAVIHALEGVIAVTAEA
ncbi:MAG TPA: nicotinamide-nucleotide amidohydrolase family protein [Thauera sp.]|uniref:CinA family protein n=1 Tax=Thauera sp. TaxID=1905334 RepID=UPI002C97EFEB|nr:nicotinamide-nucleotide amidohydrolase family protein [Thauera sp.]HRP22394.1 nicotinamide-nucleotide amidohydrolase family protein [Thauera sp.]HRP65308.1 nicotinamide-nucleotide amidohydrolase family protein [Thauera sp.]